MAKSPDAFRTISEVAEWLGIQAHVLRFWESKFTQVKPVKRAGGRRYYRPSDMQLLGGIRKLLHDDGLTIKGVQKILREQGVGHVAGLSHPIDDMGLAASPDAGQQIEGTVVAFQGRAERTDGEPQAESQQIDLDLDDDATMPAPPLAASPEPEPVGEAPAPAASLPAFLHHSAEEPATGAAPAATVCDTDSDISADPPAPRPAISDPPDPLPDDSLDCPPGVLGRLSRLNALTRDQARQVAPLAQQLRGWLETRRHAGPD